MATTVTTGVVSTSTTAASRLRVASGACRATIQRAPGKARRRAGGSAGHRQRWAPGRGYGGGRPVRAGQPTDEGAAGPDAVTSVARSRAGASSSSAADSHQSRKRAYWSSSQLTPLPAVGVRPAALVEECVAAGWSLGPFLECYRVGPLPVSAHCQARASGPVVP
jgi:hypothetical protein